MLTLQKPGDILSQILCRWNVGQLRKQNALPKAMISLITSHAVAHQGDTKPTKDKSGTKKDNLSQKWTLLTREFKKWSSVSDSLLLIKENKGVHIQCLEVTHYL